jgi:hypothetical protein
MSFCSACPWGVRSATLGSRRRQCAGVDYARDVLRRRLVSLGAPLAWVYLLSVAVLEILRRTTSWPRADDLASSPAGVAGGHLWPLVTSGLVVAGDPLVQLTGLGLTALAVIELLGAPAFWLAAAAAHLGSAVLAYAGIGALWLIARADVDAVVSAPDYGVSAVWAGTVGALVASGLGRRRRLDRLLAVGAIAGFVCVAGLPEGVAGAEHVLAFALGAMVVAGLGRRQAKAVVAATAG